MTMYQISITSRNLCCSWDDIKFLVITQSTAVRRAEDGDSRAEEYAEH